MKTIKELRKLELKKLIEELKKHQSELFKVKFAVNNGQSKNTHKIREYKKQIAKIKTIITQISENNNENLTTKENEN